MFGEEYCFGYKKETIPIYQSAIQHIPSKKGKEIGAYALGILLGNKVKAMVNSSVVRLDLREVIQRQMFIGLYETTITGWVKQCLLVGDTFIDVGASFGYYTTLGAWLVTEMGKVFSFEPSPIANQVLEDMISKSLHRNIILTKAAVGNISGDIQLYLPNSRELHSPSILQSDSKFSPINVPIITLDSFAPLAKIPKIKLVKIDVEGYEPNVLAGMEQLIKGNIVENIICEFNSWWLDKNSTTPKQLNEMFLDYGYKIHMQTELNTNMISRYGDKFSLQDKWFSR
jgi:FkbM family methyltransferase